MPHRLCVSLLAIGLTIISDVLTHPQQPSTLPNFRAGTQLVLVDFVVSDKTGHPMAGLTAADFVLKEDGRERPIVAFEAFVGGAQPPSATPNPAPSSTRPAAPTQTRVATVLFVDDGQMSPQQAMRLRPALKMLVDSVGEHAGTVMLVAPLSKVSVAADLPNGKAELTAAVDSIIGHRFEDHSTYPVADAEAFAIARGDSAALARVTSRFIALNPGLGAEAASGLAHNRGIEVAHDARVRRDLTYGVQLLSLDWLGNLPGRHSLLVVSGGFAREPDDSKYYEVVTRSLHVNAPIHFLDARGLPGIGRYQGVEYGAGLSRDADEGPFGWTEAAEGSMTLAADTGGIAITNANDVALGLSRLFDSMKTYYILGYEAPPHAKPGFRRIKVETRARGANVRARRGYFDGPH